MYRQTAADLSAARDDPSSAELARDLNHLLGRAHNVIYSGSRHARGGVVLFVTQTFPRTFRQTLPCTAVATALFAAGAVAGVLLTLAEPAFERHLLGPDMIDTIERREMWTHGMVAVKPLASTGIMTNNLAVAFAACATGAFAGLGPFYMMLFNGLLLGVIGAACARAGMGVQLWSFVAPHGALELPAIVIAGGAGFVLAQAMIAPGLLSRREALADAGAAAVRLFLGVIPLLVIAGVIEGFVSPVNIPAAAKFAAGASLFVLLCLYLFGAGRVRSGSGPSPSDIR